MHTDSDAECLSVCICVHLWFLFSSEFCWRRSPAHSHNAAKGAAANDAFDHFVLFGSPHGVIAEL